MSSINKAILVGRLGKDPETRFAHSGDAICNLSVATGESWKDKNTGERKESTEWHRVVMFGKLAEIAGQYLAKGSLVYLEGKIKTRKWQDKEGNDRYSTEIHADTMKMLGSKQDNEQPEQERPEPRRQPPHTRGSLSETDDDIPF